MDEFLESQCTFCQSFVEVRWKKLVNNLHHNWFKKEINSYHSRPSSALNRNVKKQRTIAK